MKSPELSPLFQTVSQIFGIASLRGTYQLMYFNKILGPLYRSRLYSGLAIICCALSRDRLRGSDSKLLDLYIFVSITLLHWLRDRCSSHLTGRVFFCMDPDQQVPLRESHPFVGIRSPIIYYSP
jgi:hypothetical protein